MLSALDLARRIAAGALTPAGAIDLCAAAIDAREAAVGAFAALDLAAARQAAAMPGLAALPLAGLPVGMKDIFDTVDLPTAYGSTVHGGHQPNADAAMVVLVRRAGGIILGKTATAEFASRTAVPTHNPHDLARTTGGSSSGSAAAVAAGMLPLAFGSQTGGSIIRPAAFCGVAGFKPSYRLLPTPGMKCSSWSLDTVGLFAAGIADVAYAAAAVSGRDLRVDNRPLPPPTIALVRGPRWNDASAEMRSALERAAGAAVDEVALPDIFEQAGEAHSVISGYESSRSLAFEHDRYGDQLGAELRAHLDHARTISVDDYDNARRTARRARRALLELLPDGVVILTPSANGAAPLGNGSGESGFNRLWTLLGTPCVNVPGLTDAQGLPLGMQVVARFGRDRFALTAAAFLEQALAGAGARQPAAASADR